MERFEAVKIANILMEHFKMPVARDGMFASHVTTDTEGRTLLFVGAGGCGLYIDIETVEVARKVKRNNFLIEEVEDSPKIKLVDPFIKLYNPEDYED